MKEFWRNLISRFTMRYRHCLFVDKVNGRKVNLYVDKFGVEWMAHSPFELFRVKRNDSK